MNQTQPRRLALANLPTPIIKLPGPELVSGKSIFIWRDDLTEFLGSGNKIRKLEYLLADAQDQGATHLVTCGGPQSNHARATVLMGRRVGLPTTVVVREPPQGQQAIRKTTGNLFLSQLAGADIRYIRYTDYQQRGASYQGFLSEVAAEIRAAGGSPYIIPEGGSCPLGCWGYLRAAGELCESWKGLGRESKFPDQIFIALGSGGTQVGLHLGLERLGVETERLLAINVCDDKAYFEQRCGQLLAETRNAYHLPAGSDKLTIVDGYVGPGYAEATADDLAFYRSLFESSGMLLDPCYTGKAFRGMLAELRKRPEQFGRDILFLHSGGLFANFAYGEAFLGS